MGSVFTFHHVALSVSDIERSAAFYSHFGFEQVRVWEADDSSLRIVHLKNGAALLELFGYRDYEALPEAAKNLDSDLRVVGTKHFGLHVQDIHAVYDRLRNEGIPIESELRMGRTGIEYFFMKDPDGILFELVEETGNFEEWHKKD